MLNENTRRGLNTLTTIGNAAILRYPWTSVLQKDKSVIAFINLEEYGEDSFEEFGLDNMSEFLSLVEFYKNPEISLDRGVLTLETDRYKQKYGTSDLDTMKSFNVQVETLKKISETPEIVSFEISTEELKEFKKIISLTKATSFLIKNKEEKDSVVVCRLDKNYNASEDSSIDFLMSSKQIGTVIFDASNIQKLPDKNYSVSIKRSSATGNCISIWEVDDEPMKIVVTIEDYLEGK